MTATPDAPIPNNSTAGIVGSDALFGWIECSERLPEDFERVVIQGSGLGCFVGSLYKGVWRVDTPLHSGIGRRIMIELDGGLCLPQPERWMPLPNTKHMEG